MKLTWKKIWYFIWEDNSIWSWIVNIILAFVLIKYLLYPGLGLIFGTGFPIVAVVSGSMEHHSSPVCKEINDQTKKCIDYSKTDFKICGKIVNEKKYFKSDDYWEVCGDWYENKGISKNNFETFPFRNGFNKGDIMILFGLKPESVKIGEVIVFKDGKPDPFIHRVINKYKDDEYPITTKGDNNPESIINNYLDETDIREEQLIGKAVFRIPFLGWIKIWFVDLLVFLNII